MMKTRNSSLTAPQNQGIAGRFWARRHAGGCQGGRDRGGAITDDKPEPRGVFAMLKNAFAQLIAPQGLDDLDATLINLAVMAALILSFVVGLVVIDRDTINNFHLVENIEHSQFAVSFALSPLCLYVDIAAHKQTKNVLQGFRSFVVLKFEEHYPNMQWTYDMRLPDGLPMQMITPGTITPSSPSYISLSKPGQSWNEALISTKGETARGVINFREILINPEGSTPRSFTLIGSHHWEMKQQLYAAVAYLKLVDKDQILPKLTELARHLTYPGVGSNWGQARSYALTGALCCTFLTTVVIASIFMHLALTLSDAREDATGAVAERLSRMLSPFLLFLVVILMTGMIFFFALLGIALEIQLPQRNNASLYASLQLFILVPIITVVVVGTLISIPYANAAPRVLKSARQSEEPGKNRSKPDDAAIHLNSQEDTSTTPGKLPIAQDGRGVLIASSSHREEEQVLKSKHTASTGVLVDAD